MIELPFDRYKFVVQVVIGEQRGEGVRMASRCFWDSDSDNYASETFINVLIIHVFTYESGLVVLCCLCVWCILLLINCIKYPFCLF